MVHASHKKFIFGFCECRPQMPYRGRSLAKHIKDTKHNTNQFLFCPDHLILLEKAASNTDKEQFYRIHNNCNNTKTNSLKVKEFFAARQTHNYIQEHRHTPEKRVTPEMTVTQETEDEEVEEQNVDWEELLLGDLTQKESEAETAVTNLIASEPTLSTHEARSNTLNARSHKHNT